MATTRYDSNGLPIQSGGNQNSTYTSRGLSVASGPQGQLTSDYRYEPNAQGGVNYFNRSTPITNAEYARATNSDTGMLEQQAASQGQSQAYEETIRRMIEGYGAGGSGGAGSNAQIQELGGQLYDLSNPQQAKAYYDAANAEAYGMAEQNYQTTSRNIGRSRDNLRYNTDLSLKDLMAQRESLRAEKENYFSDLEKQGRDFVTGKAVGDTTRQNYFSNLGSNAFQSSQATSQDFADGQFADGLAEQQKAGMDAQTKFTGRAGQYDTQEQSLMRQAGQDETDLATAEADNLFQRDNYVNTNRGQLAQGLAQAGADNGYTDYASKYKVDPYSNVNTVKPDLSGAQQYTNFKPGQTAQAGTGVSKFAGIGGQDTEPLDNYFGYKTSEKDKGRIKNYFSGKPV